MPKYKKREPAKVSDIPKIFETTYSVFNNGHYAINDNEQAKATDYIMSLNAFLENVSELLPKLPVLRIKKSLINYNVRPKCSFDFCNIVNTPLTPTGAIPKYVQVLNFYTNEIDHISNDATGVFGEIFLLSNGEIGKSRIIYWYHGRLFVIKCGLKKNKLCVTSVDESNHDGSYVKLYKYENK